MLRKLPGRPSPGVVVAIVALVLALTGSAIALPGRDSVNSGDIKNNTVRSKDLKNGKGVKSADVKNGSLKGRDLAGDTVTGAQVDESSLGVVAKNDLLWALVDLDSGGATVVRGNGATGASRSLVGIFKATFNRDVSACVIQATPAEASGGLSPPNDQSSPPGFHISVNDDGANGVDLLTLDDDDGNRVDPGPSDGASVTVFC